MIEQGYYWLESERSSYKAVTQYINGRFYFMAEAGAFSLDDIYHRGWDLGDRIEGQDL